MDKQKRISKTKRPPVATPPTELTGEALKYAMEHNEELIEGTKKGYEDIKAGRVYTLEELKRSLGDV